MMVLLMVIAVDVAVMAQNPSLMPTKNPTSVETYYSSIDFSATNEVLKKQLHDLINPHTVWSYDDAWSAFSSIDVNLPTYPCNPSNLTYIPDIYSGFCWDPEKIAVGGECGDYKKEVRSNRERITSSLYLSIFYLQTTQSSRSPLLASSHFPSFYHLHLSFSSHSLSISLPFTPSSHTTFQGDCYNREHLWPKSW